MSNILKFEDRKTFYIASISFRGANDTLAFSEIYLDQPESRTETFLKRLKNISKEFKVLPLGERNLFRSQSEQDLIFIESNEEFENYISNIEKGIL